MTDVTPTEYTLIQKMGDYEKTMTDAQERLGWRWFEVGIGAGSLTKFIIRGLIRISYKSRSATHYLLTDEGRTVYEGGEQSIESQEAVPEAPLPGELVVMFNDIIGYDDIKELLRESLQLDKPLHVLLHGPPSLAKSMFLWDIEQTYGEQTMPLLGSATSHAGLWDLIAEKRPRIILVDEIEKMSLADMAGLLSLMQTGRIIRAKVGRKLDVQVTAWVIAAANRIYRMPAELLSRFSRKELGEYKSSEYQQVVKNVLVAHENTSEDDAAEIAIRLLGRTHDVRDAVRVARLAQRVGVARAVELLFR